MSDQALADGLVVALKAAPAITAILGQRIYARAPRVPTYPCLAVSRTESRIVEGEVVEHLLTLTCVSKFGGPEEARAVVAAVRAVIHDARPTIVGRRLVNLRVAYADVFPAADRELTLGIVRVRAVTEPL